MNTIILKNSVETILSSFSVAMDELVDLYREPEIVDRDDVGYPIYNDCFNSVISLSNNYVVDLDFKLSEFKAKNNLEKGDLTQVFFWIEKIVREKIKRLDNIGEPNPEGYYSEWNVKNYLSICNSVLEYCKEELKTIELNPSQTISPQIYPSNLEWDSQTEISELIYVLYKSKKIKLNGKPIEQRILTEIFCNLFNTKIKTPTDYLNKSATTYKKNLDKKTLMNELKGYIDEYNERIIEKEK